MEELTFDLRPENEKESVSCERTGKIILTKQLMQRL